MGRMIILETNEVPLSVFQWYAERVPESAIAGLLRDGDVAETVNTDDLGDRELYPSQSWATLGMGVPFEDHGVYWYGDPKPGEYPFYWQAAAKQRSVGVFGSLHTSLPTGGAPPSDYSFFVPDVFSESAATNPSSLSELQDFSIGMTKANARAVSSIAPLQRYASGLRGALRAGVGVRTFIGLAQTAAGVALKRIPKERLRTAQFKLLSDPFERLVRDSDPDLAVFFTNHVAAAMHRYWFASFPQDWEEPLFDDDWIARFAGELPAALDALDAMIGRLFAFSVKTNRSLVLVSSMGQSGGAPLHQSGESALVVNDIGRFVQGLGIGADHEIRSSMVPHVCVAFTSETSAKAEVEALQKLDPTAESLRIDRAGNVVTISYELLPAGKGKTQINGQVFGLGELGLAEVKVEEHRCGVHQPRGALIVGNSRTATGAGQVPDVREFAPAVLASLGAPALPHHRIPSFSL